MPAMIYHAPFPLDRNASSASGIRPVKMIDAFRDLGYEVLDVTGRAAERARRVRAVRRRLEAGQEIDLLYSECATIPTMLTEPRHLPPHPLVDPVLFALARRHGVPTSLFYRDVYWAFPDYVRRVGRPTATAMKRLYTYDLTWYRHLVDVLHLPSMRMAEYVPVYPRERMTALPPGCDISDPPAHARRPRTLHLLYIGGLGGHYRLQECVRGVVATPGVELTICTRSDQWEASQQDYLPLMDDSVRIVHRSGAELDELYAAADACVLYVEPDPYREFAAPVKLYEYLGRGMPVIASAGTLAASLVADTGAGWTPMYDWRDLRGLLSRLLDHSDDLEHAAGAARRARSEHTWTARAEQVVRDCAAIQRSH